MIESFLCIDIGNTRLKWGEYVLSESGFSVTGVIPYQQNNVSLDLDSYFSKLNPQPVWFASVASNKLSEYIIKWVKTNWSMPVRDIGNEMFRFEHLNNYKITSGFGVDRWLALVSAQYRYKHGFCIVDAGTAVTIDVVDMDGVHIGGMIMPGRQLMILSLIEGAEGIGNIKGSSSRLADNTSDAVYSGVLSCFVGGVERALNAIAKDNVNMRFILTGGDADFLAGYINRDVILEKKLVIEGVGLVARDTYA